MKRASFEDYKNYCALKKLKGSHYEVIKEYELYLEWCDLTGDNFKDTRVIKDFDTDDIVRCPMCEELELAHEMTEVKGVEICRECLNHI